MCKRSTRPATGACILQRFSHVKSCSLTVQQKHYGNEKLVQVFAGVSICLESSHKKVFLTVVCQSLKTFHTFCGKKTSSDGVNWVCVLCGLTTEAAVAKTV